jgi:hypothetical protein
MNEKQAPPRMLRISIYVLFIGIVGLLLWLSIAPPAAYAPFQPWFRAALNLFVGIILTACGLFYDSWFAALMGAQNSSIILRFGPTRARIVYIVIGLIFLVVGIVRVLHH